MNEQNLVWFGISKDDLVGIPTAPHNHRCKNLIIYPDGVHDSGYTFSSALCLNAHIGQRSVKQDLLHSFVCKSFDNIVWTVDGSQDWANQDVLNMDACPGGGIRYWTYQWDLVVKMPGETLYVTIQQPITQPTKDCSLDG